MVFSSLILVVVVATLAQSVLSYPFYYVVIPNAKSIGKSLGHTDIGSYTAFGRLFRENDKLWSNVCMLPWPSHPTLTVGSVLGDPCCKWTGGRPDYVLTEPNFDGTVCGGAVAGEATLAKPTAAAPAASPPILIARAPVATPVTSAGQLSSNAPTQIAAQANNTTAASGKPEVLCEAA